MARYDYKAFTSLVSNVCQNIDDKNGEASSMVKIIKTIKFKAG